MNDAADSSMPGPDGTTAAAAVFGAAEAVLVTVADADPASAPASSTVVSLRPLPDVFLNADPTPDVSAPPRTGRRLYRHESGPSGPA
ncbi:hypothetical protein AB0L04_32315 [Streptomyces glaucescens]|uniref:hypothetical protein n=1 Tax=Streptomyces glaucescens TaxID=1907 RepID=UPI00344DA680